MCTPPCAGWAPRCWWTAWRYAPGTPCCSPVWPRTGISSACPASSPASSGLVTLAEPLLRTLAARPPAAPYRTPLAAPVHGHPQDTRLVPVAYREDERHGLTAAPLRFHGPAMLWHRLRRCAGRRPARWRGAWHRVLQRTSPAGWLPVSLRSAAPPRARRPIRRRGGQPPLQPPSARCSRPLRPRQLLGTACLMVITRSVSSSVAACGSV